MNESVRLPAAVVSRPYYWHTAEHAARTDDAVSHEFGGESTLQGSICPNCHLPFTRFLRLDTSDPAIRPAPGSTPVAVQLSGLWSGSLQKAHLEWTASDNPDLDHYSVRSCDPPRYRAQDEATVENVAAGTLELDTDLGLLAPGSAKIFKVYVVTTEDNEKGSNSVKVTHPE